MRKKITFWREARKDKNKIYTPAIFKTNLRSQTIKNFVDGYTFGTLTPVQNFRKIKSGHFQELFSA